MKEKKTIMKEKKLTPKKNYKNWTFGKSYDFFSYKHGNSAYILNDKQNYILVYEVDKHFTIKKPLEFWELENPTFEDLDMVDKISMKHPNEAFKNQMMAGLKLIMLRDAFNNGWKVELFDHTKTKYYISPELRVRNGENVYDILMFETKEKATRFLNLYKKLIIEWFKMYNFRYSWE